MFKRTVPSLARAKSIQKTSRQLIPTMDYHCMRPVYSKKKNALFSFIDDDNKLNMKYHEGYISRDNIKVIIIAQVYLRGN